MNQPYIFLNLMGGLGNQLFQYACGLLHKKDGTLILCSPHTNIHDTQDYRTILFNLGIPYDFPVPNCLTLYQEDAYAPWNPDDYNEQYIKLYGYFQNYPTLQPILPFFKFNILNQLVLKREMMCQKYKVSFSCYFIHVRRGDYVNNKDVSQLYDLEYYRKAYKLISKNRLIYKLYIFSDDIEWCKKQEFFQSLNPIYVEETDPINSLALMCEIKDGAIIANSTFSWMGAYLGCGLKANSVIYPKQWVTDKTVDICPPEWIGI